MAKKTYSDLLTERNNLERRVKELEHAQRMADRHPCFFQYMQWVAVPLKPAQKAAVEDHFEEMLCYDDYKVVGDERRYQEYHESDILPEFSVYLVRYSTDLEGNKISATSVWGLVPV